MTEIKRILCPVDLSDISRHAIDHVLLLARWYKASVTALHVCNPVVIPATDFAAIGAYIPPALTDDEIRQVREEVAACFAPAADLDVEVQVQTGDASRQIIEVAKSLPADLIVIGTHGLGGFQHLVLGSVSEKVLRQATCPVLTVPPQSRTTSKLPFAKILCTVDFAEPSAAALEAACALAREGDTDLTVLHVLEWPEEPLTTRSIATPEFRMQLESELLEQLNRFASHAADRSCRLTPRVAHGKPYREILTIANEDGFDLIVMGVHGRNAFDLMLFGSTTSQVIRRATCPVLSVRR